MRPHNATNDPLAGTARLPVVVIAAMATFLFAAVLEYSLPLYFNAVEGFSKNTWSELVLWQVMPFIFTPVLAGLLSRRFGERRVWGAALVGQALAPVILWVAPHTWTIRPLAFWNGFAGALMWVGGVSLVQIVPRKQKGLANGLMMMSLGVGSLLGPLVGRALLWRQYLGELLGSPREVGEFLVNLTPPPSDPPLENFRLLLFGLSALALANAVFVGFLGQRPGRVPGEQEAHTVRHALADLRRLMANPRFWALTLTLCLLGGPVFQATNQFLKYRAEDVGLIVGSQDRGWVWLQLLRTSMWIPGGLAVGFLAGRRAPGIVAVVMLASFSLCALGLGLVNSSAELLIAAAAFEFVRQFMRWSHSGYLSEHMPAELRATAIGCSIALSGLGSTLFGALPLAIMDAGAAGFDASKPFFIAATLGLTGAAALFVFDRFRPIRQSSEAVPQVDFTPRCESITP